jgi:cell pole-organizing protein PopZ
MAFSKYIITYGIRGLFAVCLLMMCLSPAVTAAAIPVDEKTQDPASIEHQMSSNSGGPATNTSTQYEATRITQTSSGVDITHTVVLTDVSEDTRVQFSATSPAVQQVDPGPFKNINTSNTRYSWRASSDSKKIVLNFSYTLAEEVITRTNGENSTNARGTFLRDYRQFTLYSNHTTNAIPRRTSLEGVGIMTTQMAYVGKSSVYAVNENGTQYSLVVPRAAADSLYANPERLTAQLASSGGLLSAGKYHNDVTIIAAPTAELEDHRAGIFWPGTAEGWVSAAASERTFPSAWYHEMTHAAQPYDHKSDAKWFIEGTAEYYGVILPHEVSPYDADLQRALSPTEQSQLTLSNQSTWSTSRTPYDDGSIVAARLDQKIRNETNGSKTLTDLLKRVAAAHSQRNPVGNDDVINHTRSIAGEETAQWLIEVTTEPLTGSTRNEMEQQLDITELATEQTEIGSSNQTSFQPTPDNDPAPRLPSNSGSKGILAQVIELMRQILSYHAIPEA